ncbi:sulfur oxidation c-type cytochrome SoxX [Taklimakanibacter lacteus]|uniref:sulfur oxidation c-type cytochrome SoxX n=1 Tax=Taklimakanibacter lacteus TaxID=2268456 RepID=UPI000E65ECB8
MRLALIVVVLLAAPAAAEPLRSYSIAGDAIVQPLTGHPGDASRGRTLLANRQASLCLLCHQAPVPEPHAQGTLAPDLSGVGGRLSEGQIRLRIVDMAHISPSTIMPSYYRISDHPRTAEAWRGRPVLGAEDIEDIVAFLVTLKE